jgi:hypothetical protein
MKNISLLYDEDCPLCRWYTRIFVKYRLLEENGRIPYVDYILQHPGEVNIHIAQTKIACVDHQSHEIRYGIDGLLMLLGHHSRIIKVLGNFKPINWLLKILYLLFSYNRRIFAPVSKRNVECTCEPPKSILWRINFILLMSFITYAIVQWYFHQFLDEYLVNTPPNDLILLAAQIGFQWLAFLFLHQKNSYDYIGHLVFVSFLGSLLLLFFGIGIQLINYLGIETHFLAVVCYGMTVAYMFFEHKRRVALKEWTWKLSLSWILFRICIYPLVFQL